MPICRKARDKSPSFVGLLLELAARRRHLEWLVGLLPPGSACGMPFGEVLVYLPPSLNPSCPSQTDNTPTTSFASFLMRTQMVGASPSGHSS